MEERASHLLSRTCWSAACSVSLARSTCWSGLAGFVHSPLLNFAIAAVLVVRAAVFPVAISSLPSLQTNWVGRSIWAGDPRDSHRRSDYSGSCRLPAAMS